MVMLAVNGIGVEERAIPRYLPRQRKTTKKKSITRACYLQRELNLAYFEQNAGSQQYDPHIEVILTYSRKHAKKSSVYDCTVEDIE